MPQIITYKPFSISLRLKHLDLWLGIISLAIVLSIFQDYIHSRVHNTGFYLSESLLYNSIWLFLIPISVFQMKLLEFFQFENRKGKFGIFLVIAGILTLLHIVLFSLFFALISYFVFSPTHHFSIIYNAAFSNQFYILALFYLCIPFLLNTSRISEPNKKAKLEHTDNITVKLGLRIISLKINDIEFISSEKPYSAINLDGKTYLDNRSLRDLKKILNSNFRRVHRSVIINKNMIKELKSRRNGDYDCILKNGNILRLSRHYRKNWEDLLQ